MKNKGFSLIELIVVIAIMAVLTAVLAPALLSYTERSRAGKDVSAMDEVVNAVVLSASDGRVYDELVAHSYDHNASCYIDKETDHGYAMIPTKVNSNGEIVQYIFGDETRLSDETPFYAAGNMRGVTITFEPQRSSTTSTLKLADGVVNKFLDSGGVDIEECPLLYNSLRLTIGDTLPLSSQTYRNSEYTVFIRVGSFGGNDAAAQDSVQAYGQFSGTNLPNADITYTTAKNETTLVAVKDVINGAIDDAKDWYEDNEDEIKDAVAEGVGKAEDWYEDNKDEIGEAVGDIEDQVGDLIDGGSNNDDSGDDDNKGGLGDLIGGLIGKWPWGR